MTDAARMFLAGTLGLLTACSTPPPRQPPEERPAATASTTTPGYRLESEEHTFVRVFDDLTYQAIHDFPATMTGCDHGKFVVRWRSLSADVPVSMVPVWAGAVDLAPVEGAEPLVGTSGRWESRSQCEQPAWVLLPDDGGDGAAFFADVVVEYEVWVAVP